MFGLEIPVQCDLHWPWLFFCFSPHFNSLHWALVCVCCRRSNVTQLTTYIDVNNKWTFRPTSRQLEKIVMINAKNGKINRMHHTLYSVGNFMHTNHTHADYSEFSKENRYMRRFLLGIKCMALLCEVCACVNYRNKNCGVFRSESFTIVASIDFRTIRARFVCHIFANTKHLFRFPSTIRKPVLSIFNGWQMKSLIYRCHTNSVDETFLSHWI